MPNAKREILIPEYFTSSNFRQIDFLWFQPVFTILIEFKVKSLKRPNSQLFYNYDFYYTFCYRLQVH